MGFKRVTKRGVHENNKPSAGIRFPWKQTGIDVVRRWWWGGKVLDQTSVICEVQCMFWICIAAFQVGALPIRSRSIRAEARSQTAGCYFEVCPCWDARLDRWMVSFDVVCSLHISLCERRAGGVQILVGGPEVSSIRTNILTRYISFYCFVSYRKLNKCIIMFKNIG
jgi:hypothetical protein